MRDASPDGVTVERVSFPSGPAVLAGTLYLPASAPSAAVVLNAATGVPQDYYRPFARWLAATRGIACLTYVSHPGR